MPWIAEVTATGKIIEMQNPRNPVAQTMIDTMTQNAVKSGYLAQDVNVSEITESAYRTRIESDPVYIAEKAAEDDEKVSVERKVLGSILFELVNEIRVLKSQSPITKQQFIDNLKSRR